MVVILSMEEGAVIYLLFTGVGTKLYFHLLLSIILSRYYLFKFKALSTPLLFFNKQPILCLDAVIPIAVSSVGN